MILPALVEATSPGYHPIKYALFPPLGLAGLAGYLDPDVEVELVDEHVQPLDWNDDPDLVLMSVYITSARRAYTDLRPLSSQGRARVPRRSASELEAGRGRSTRRHDLHRTRRGELAPLPRGLRTRRAAAPVRVPGQNPRGPPAAAPGPDRARPLPLPELARRLPGLPAPLRLLLQGRVLRGRAVLLHADRRRGARGDRPPARTAPLLPRRPPVRQPAVRRGAVHRHGRDGACLPGREHCQRHPADGSHRTRGGRGDAERLRRLRDGERGEPPPPREAAEPGPLLRRGDPALPRTRA